MVKKKPKPLLFILVFIFFIFLLLIGVSVSWVYFTSPVDKNDDDIITIEVKSGEGVTGIASTLKSKNLIKNEFVFKIYVKINNVSSLKAAHYQLSRSMDMAEIVKSLEEGSTYNPNLVVLTFKEGKKITDYAKMISKNTNNNYADIITVFKDKVYATSLINKYWFLTDKILDDNIYYPLEGYLFPDTYHFENKDVTVNEIIEKMLDEMDNKLDKYKKDISKDIHSYITMASIVELEGTNTENRKMIVGVFNNRLKSGMNMGSDVTTYYGLQEDMTKDLTSTQFSSVNGYNTRSTTMIGKLPVGPICSPSISSIESSLYPTNSDYLYFVADKNGKIYYTKTMKEHEKKIAEIKANGDWIW